MDISRFFLADIQKTQVWTQNAILTLKYIGDSIMLWGQLGRVDRRIDWTKFKKIMEEALLEGKTQDWGEGSPSIRTMGQNIQIQIHNGPD